VSLPCALRHRKDGHTTQPREQCTEQCWRCHDRLRYKPPSNQMSLLVQHKNGFFSPTLRLDRDRTVTDRGSDRSRELFSSCMHCTTVARSIANLLGAMRRCSTIGTCAARSTTNGCAPRASVSRSTQWISRASGQRGGGVSLASTTALDGMRGLATQTLRPPPPPPPPSGVPLGTAVGMAAAAAGLAAAVTSWWKSRESSSGSGAPVGQPTATTTATASSEETTTAVATVPTDAATDAPTETTTPDTDAPAAATGTVMPKLAVGVMDGREAELVRVAPISGKTASPDGVNLVIFHGGCPGA
jgi:hypothetical protein